MITIWNEAIESAGKKAFTMHELRDGFLMTMRWNWKETDIHQEIVFFAPLDQAQAMAETILAHITRMRILNMSLGGAKPNTPDPPGPDDPVPDPTCGPSES